MPVLTEQEREDAYGKYMTTLSQRSSPLNVLKSEGRAALDAIDTWTNDNASDINNTLPEPYRTEATTEQKALLQSAVNTARYIKDPI